jgi:hypothetical protein
MVCQTGCSIHYLGKGYGMESPIPQPKQPSTDVQRSASSGTLQQDHELEASINWNGSISMAVSFHY